MTSEPIPIGGPTGARPRKPAAKRPFSARTLVLGLGTGLVVGIATPTFVALVRAWGHRIPQPAMEADYLFGLVWALLLGFSILLWPGPRQDVRPLLLLWGAKCCVTLGFMLLYEWNYGLDAYNYFHVSTRPRFDFSTTGFGAGTQNMEAIAWLHSYLLPDSYHAMKVSLAMCGLVAIYLTYRGAVRFLGRDDHRLLLALGLFPSILFWSSILGKDPLQLLGIGLYVYGVACWRTGHTARGTVAISTGVILAAYIRLWAGPILIFPLAIYSILGVRGWFRRALLLVACCAALGLAVSTFARQLGFESLQDVYTIADQMSQGESWAGGSGQSYDVNFDSAGSMIRFLPTGMFAALFRPLPGEVMNPFGLLAGLENLALLFLLAFAALRSRWSDLREPLTIWAIVLVLSWSTVYGFISAYNLGAAVRFKLQILPVLLCLLLFLARRRDTGGRGGTRQVTLAPSTL